MVRCIQYCRLDVEVVECLGSLLFAKGELCLRCSNLDGWSVLRVQRVTGAMLWYRLEGCSICFGGADKLRVSLSRKKMVHSIEVKKLQFVSS